MQTIIKTIVILFSPVLLPSCSNALYFYETDKISLSVDARPDSSQPVQGNLGIKQRVALITPSTKNAEGDALSSINSFRFKIADETGFDPVTIQTAFITGNAASCLNQEQAATAASILAQSGEPQVVTSVSQELQSRRENAATFIKGLSSNELDTLATAMDKEPGTNALSDILSAITAANTTTSFEVINQKLKVLFGRSF